MRVLMTGVLAAALVLGLSAGASGRSSSPEWLTFNEVTLDGRRHVLSRHQIWPATSSLSPDHRRLAFVPQSACETCGPANVLYVADVRGPRQRVLFQSQDGITSVAWAPDGESIAFASAGIWLIAPDGSNLRRIGEPASFLAWSPDSSQIAYMVLREGNWLIRTLSLPSGSTRDLVGGQNVRWSPDGTRIAYERLRGGPCSVQIRILTLRSGTERAVACGSLPNWAPDGRRIAFARFGATDTSASLWVARVRGGKPRRLAEQNLLPDDYATAIWSEDSDWIAFRRGARYCRSRLSVVRVENGRTRRLAAHTRIVTPLAWSSNSRKLLYTGERCTDQ